MENKLRKMFLSWKGRLWFCLTANSWCLFSEEAEDDDDPEYNFPEDLDEPDLEDYRTDRAVQITSKWCAVRRRRSFESVRILTVNSASCFSEKEVNELLEELFETVSSYFVSANLTRCHFTLTGLVFNVSMWARLQTFSCFPLLCSSRKKKRWWLRRRSMRKRSPRHRLALSSTCHRLYGTDSCIPVHDAQLRNIQTHVKKQFLKKI